MTLLAPVAPAALAADPVTVTITDSLSPKDLTVEPGTTVTWTNDDADEHRIRSQSGPVDFDSGNLDPGQSYSFTFDAEGTYSYLDDRDDENTAYFGTIVVSAQAPPPGGGGPSGDATVDLIDDTFRPRDITIDAGSTVVWRNIDDRSHTVTAGDGSFDSGIFDVGTFTRTFDVPGVYNYLCILHSGMVGSVTVNGSGGTPPPPLPDPGPDPTPPPTPVDGDVIIFDNGYTPASLDILVGTTLTFANTGNLPHTVTDGAGRFDSGLMMSADTYTRTFSNAGTYNYYCTIHPEMTATVVVTDESGGTPPPPPLPPEPGPDTTPPSSVSGDVTIFDNGYTPRSKIVSVGTRVTFANTGGLPHTVTDRAGSFDSGLMMSGDTYRRTFTTAGTFDYYCTLHPEMTATLIVTGADGTAPPPEAPTDTSKTGDIGTVRVGPSDIKIVDNDYQPRTIEVGIGSTLTWVNAGALPHTVTDKARGFDSGLMMTGDAYRRTFNTAGTFEYYCTIHPEMAATVKVAEGAAKVGSGDAAQDGVVPAGANDKAQATGEPSEKDAEVDVIDLDYDPRDLTVTAGSTVVWTNIGDLPHTVTAEGLFDSGLMMTGDRFTWTFDTPGTYDYLCTLHPGMVGTVTVEDGEEFGSGVLAAGSSDGTSTAALDGSPAGSTRGADTLSTILVIALIVALGATAVFAIRAVGRAAVAIREDSRSA
jgi:plastocyanin